MDDSFQKKQFLACTGKTVSQSCFFSRSGNQVPFVNEPIPQLSLQLEGRKLFISVTAYLSIVAEDMLHCALHSTVAQNSTEEESRQCGTINLFKDSPSPQKGCQ